MSPQDFSAEYAAYCAEHGVPERLELMMIDTNAILRGKWLPGDAGSKLVKGAVRLPVSTYALNVMGQDVDTTGYGIGVGDPDGIATAVPGSLRKVPWFEEHVAQVQICLMGDDGGVHQMDPREILRRQVARFHALGLRPVVATELEFYVIQSRATAQEAPRPPEHTPEAQPYDLDACFQSEAVLQDILEACSIQGLPTDTLIAEYSPGQFEINFHHVDDAVQAADYAVMFRRLVRHVARRSGLDATFMAKPYAEHPGNGMHVHMSLINEQGENIFTPKNGEKISEPLLNAVSGVIDAMSDCQAIFAPGMNSYRRFQPNSFAPHTPDWGLDHRGAAVRLPETQGAGARLEHRLCGADVNPYLALAAILGGVLHGLENKPPLKHPLDHPEHETSPALPRNWKNAVDRFEGSDLITTMFGSHFQKVYTAIRRDEIEALTTPVTPMEYQTYLGRM